MHLIPANSGNKIDRPKVILFIAYNGLTLLDVAGPMQVFESANNFRCQMGKAAPYEIKLVTCQSGRVQSDVGVFLEATDWNDGPTDHSMVIVPGGPGVWNADVQAFVGAYLKSQPEHVEIASVCIGAFLLGYSGLLAGKRAVTHWRYCKKLKNDFPDALVNSDSIFTRDGKIWTSAGVTAGIDLALAIVERDLGHSLAAEVARGLVVFLRRSEGQSQYSKLLELQASTPDGRLSDLHAWVSDNLHKPLRVETLALRVGMSARSFARFYVEQTGFTPRRAIENLRIDTAQRMLLDYPKMSIKRIADKCGFIDEKRMCRIFMRLNRVTPSEFRQRYGSSYADVM